MYNWRYDMHFLVWCSEKVVKIAMENGVNLQNAIEILAEVLKNKIGKNNKKEFANIVTSVFYE